MGVKLALLSHLQSVLRRNFDQKRRKCQEAGESCLMSSFITCTLHQILLE